MNEVERYLNRATRGLWGRKRREVREELEAHISERITVHRIAGLKEADAVEQALLEMGEPREVSAGMAKLYTVPLIAGSGLLVAALCVVTVTAISIGFAQTLETAQTFPSPNCLETNSEDPLCQDASVWTTFDALKEVLEPQGVEFIEKGDTLSLQFSNGEFATAFKPALTLTLADESEKALSEDYQPKPNYLSLWDFLRELASGTNLSVRVEGWQNLTVHVGNASFMLGGTQKQAEGFYYNYLTSIAFNPNQLLARSSLKNPSIYQVGEGEGTNTLNLRVENSRPDAVYGIFTPIPALDNRHVPQ